VLSDSGFNFLPVFGRGGRSKMGRVGMAVGSMFAATLCALALFGNETPETMNKLTVDDMFNELQLRGLKALNEEDHIIEEDPVKIPRRITQRL
jgi:hypothetical protein